MKNFLTLWLSLASILPVFSQTNVRAWYAKGQVWVVWEAEQPFPQTYTIWAGNTAFSSASEATPVGRPFSYEYFPGTFLQQTLDTSFRYKIPAPDGSIYTLTGTEALFVLTPQNAGSTYIGVTAPGHTDFTAGVNRTAMPVQYNVNPQSDPVACHLQYTKMMPGGFKTNWYCLWILGKQDQGAGRPDFPVMGNVFKNGTPQMFIVSEALNMDTTGGKHIPATNLLHGGGGYAIQFTPDKFQQFNVAPVQGITVAHNDDFPHLLIDDVTGDTMFSSSRSLWFGYAKNFNPFDAGYFPGPTDTVVNYTQRRILWINDWLVKNYRVDPDRIAVEGYSMGSGGAAAIGKAFPNRFSSVVCFNNGFRGALEGTSLNIIGTVDQNLPTSLRRPNGEVLHVNQVFDLTTPTTASPARDFPVFSIWDGKNDNNGRMHWGPDVVAQFRLADSLGQGAQINWDERPHTYENLGMHWIEGIPANQQTIHDNTGFQEFFNSKQSYPAFFNHRLDPHNNDPGSGMVGINNGDGDNWGTWGGYHRWDLQNLVDAEHEWSVVAWLETNAVFDNDICPDNILLADLAIRRPQLFRPVAGTAIYWEVQSVANGAVLQSGMATVRPDNLVVIPQVAVFRENIGKVRILVTDMFAATTELSDSEKEIRVFPNPARDWILLPENVSRFRLFAANGVETIEENNISGNRVNIAGLAPGMYFVEMLMKNGARKVAKVAVQ